MIPDLPVVMEELSKLILQSFKDLQGCADAGIGRLHIPGDTLDNKRISEQELRFLFVEEFLSCPYFAEYQYSVETPTEYRYLFSDKSGKFSPVCVVNNDSGRRANIDCCIYKGNKRIAIIEFKANNPGDFEHAKDFVKLGSEPGEDLIRFFVEVYKHTDDSTLHNIHEKLYANKYVNIFNNTAFIGYSLNHKGDHSGKRIFCREEDKITIV